MKAGLPATRSSHLKERAIEHAVIPWCEEHGVAVVAYSPFGHDDFPTPRTKAAGSSGGRRCPQATPRQVALRFLLRRPSVLTIPKASRPDHVAENAGAGDLWLTEADSRGSARPSHRAPDPHIAHAVSQPASRDRAVRALRRRHAA